MTTTETNEKRQREVSEIRFGVLNLETLKKNF